MIAIDNRYKAVSMSEYFVNLILDKYIVRDFNYDTNIIYNILNNVDSILTNEDAKWITYYMTALELFINNNELSAISEYLKINIDKLTFMMTRIKIIKNDILINSFVNVKDLVVIPIKKIENITFINLIYYTGNCIKVSKNNINEYSVVPIHNGESLIYCEDTIRFYKVIIDIDFTCINEENNLISTDTTICVNDNFDMKKIYKTAHHTKNKFNKIQLEDAIMYLKYVDYKKKIMTVDDLLKNELHIGRGRYGRLNSFLRNKYRNELKKYK